MDGLSVHLPSVISEPFYDMQSHGNSYHSYQTPTNNMWTNRDDTRGYQPQVGEFDPPLRFSGSSTRRPCTSDPPIPNDSPDVVNSEWSGDESKDNRKCEQGSPRQSQVAVTLNWLSENYERAEGVCLPRCVLYQHYQEFCKRMKFTPAGAATFGKIIRQRFPRLTTRRLGTRGQSKYHYYGIGIKETSIYYHSVYSGRGLTRFSGIKLKTEGSSRKYSLSSKTGTLLPEFPNAENLILPEDTDLEKMKTFIMMYRTHCQRILDTIISANFEEVHNFLVHFWQGMPEHLLELLNCEILTDVIALCDSILYKVLIDVLIPSTIQELPHSLYGEIRLFAKRLPHWLETAMETVPTQIQSRKMEVAKGFLQSLKRQSSFVQLAQTTRSVLNNQDTLSSIVKDISSVDFVDICSQTGFMDPSANPKVFSRLMEFHDEFRELLNKQAPIEGYTEWIDEVVDKCVIKPGEGDHDLMREKGAEFLLQWGAFMGLLMRELTLKNSSSFASIHLIHLMLDEYAFLVIETQQDQETELLLQKNLQKHMKNAEEIQTKAIVRNASSKAMNSPKSKKRKTTEEFDNDNKPLMTEIQSVPECNYVNSTAFTRPAPSSKDPRSSDTINPTDTPRPAQNPITVPQLKPYQPYNNSTYDTPTYLPQFPIGSYSDYVGSNASFGARRLTSYSESYPQTFPSSPFSTNISTVSGNYWTDGRAHHTFTDPYQSYNKLAATYDPLNKSTFLRSPTYQDSFNRPAFDTSRTFYRSTHDNMQVGATFQMGTFGSNFMDIAPSAGQYCYQDDIFPTGMTSSFGKPYLSAPFR